MGKLMVLLLCGLLLENVKSDKGMLEQRLAALEKRFNKMADFMEGFEHLCSKMNWGSSKNPDDENGNEQIGEPEAIPEYTVEPETSPINSVEDHTTRIKIQSITSNEIADDKITVDIAFLAQERSSANWHVRYENTSFTRLIDRRTEGEHRVTSVTIDNADTLRGLMCVIYSDSHNVQISFNVTAILIGGTQRIYQDFNRKFLRYPPVVSFPVEEMESRGVSFPVEVSKDVIIDMLDHKHVVTVFITVVNTTESPLQVYELFGYFEDERFLVSPKDESENELVVNITAGVSKYGGIVILRILQQIDTGFIRNLEYGVRIKLVHPKVADVMPTGKVAIIRQPATLYYRGPYFALYCGGIGIPTPNIELLKCRKDGSTCVRKLKLDIESTDGELFKTGVILFTPEMKAKPDGNYLCKISNGNDMIQSKIKVEKYAPIKFDERKSTLAKNTTEKMVVTCKASGNPTPRLKLMDGPSYSGVDLLQVENERYRHKIITRGKMSKVTLTISPPIGRNETTSVINCEASQKIRQYEQTRKTFSIEIRKIQDDFTYNNFTFDYLALP